MKKISKWTRFSFIILMFLFVSFTSAAQADNLLKAASPNPAFVTWQKNAQPSANNGSPAANYGYAPSPVNWRHLDNVTYGINGRASFTKQSKAALPAVYDLRGKMPSVRNQNPFGNCWTHSAMAATESNLITKGVVKSADVYLSEWYLTYFAYKSTPAELSFTYTSPDYYNAGGDDWRAVALLARGTGSVTDKEVKTPAAIGEIYTPSVIKRSYKLVNALYLGNGGLRENQLNETKRRELIKEAIRTKGAVSVGIFWDDEAYDGTNMTFNSSNNYQTVGTNHAVTIVGWDDNFSAGKFSKHPPKANGAWIVRNSWGTDFGDRGYFYVSYEEPTLCDGVVYETETAPADERIYQYDYLGNVGFLKYDGTSLSERRNAGSLNTAYFANIFTAKGNDRLDSVALYTTVPDQQCEIKIYSGCVSSPTDGKLEATKNITVAAPGYNTITLDAPLKLTKGDKFSVVVKTTSEAEYMIPCEYVQAGYSDGAAGQTGTGWVSQDGVTYRDILTVANANSYKNAIICIKAFAAADPSEPSPSASSGGGCNAGIAPLALWGFLGLALLTFKKRA